MAKQRKSKTLSNNQFIEKAMEEGREYLFKTELPYPQLKVSNRNILAVEGSKIYLRDKI